MVAIESKSQWMFSSKKKFLIVPNTSESGFTAKTTIKSLIIASQRNGAMPKLKVI